MVILFYGVIGTGIILLIIQIGYSLKDIILKIPQTFYREIIPALNRVYENINDWISRLDPDLLDPVQNAYNGLLSELGTFLATFSSKALSAITSYATSLPRTLLDILITVIATYFIAADFEILQKSLVRQFSAKNSVLYENVKIHLGGTITKYIKAYAIIFVLSYAQLALGLWIIGIERAFLVALLIALFDLLPVVGTGMILFPWTVIAFLQGNIQRGIGLLILYIVIIVVRNIIEPKIIGDRVGMHPLVALLSMIIGLRLFGLIGLFAVPITVALLISLNQANAICIFKNEPCNIDKKDNDKGNPTKTKINKKPFFKRKGPISPVIVTDNVNKKDSKESKDSIKS
jgi:sporulation integral membrane protein YtvI